MGRAKRGMVLLYAITVFAVIASIGVTIMDSGEFFVANVRTDYHMMVAQNAALSGIAYGEATIQRMMDLATGIPSMRPPLFEDNTGGAHVSTPAWAGRDFASAPFVYVPLLGSQLVVSSTQPASPGSPGNPNVTPAPPNTTAWTMSWTQEARGGAESVRARFRIELRECSKPIRVPGYPPPPQPYVGAGSALPINGGVLGCADYLYDMNLLRTDFFWQNGSPYKPAVNKQAFGIKTVNDFYSMYTMRVEGEAVVPGAGGNFDTTAARVIAKETFTFRSDNPNRVFPIAFWYHDPARGY